MDALLDDPRFFDPFRAHFDPILGRPSVPIEVYLRLMFLKNRYRLGYETLCAEVTDSISWQRFCRIPLGGRVPHPTTLMKITTRCGSATVDELNETLIAKAVEARLVKTNRVRADTTVVEADVTYPTDSSLLTKAVGKASRLVERIQSAGAATRTMVVDNVADARRGAHAIGVWLRRRSGEAKDEVLKITGEISELAKSTMADAARVVVNARRHLQRHPDTPKAGRLAATIDELDTLIERAGRVIDQTRQRLAGQVPPGSTRLVSLHEPDARPIRKGRLGKPVEFGYKAQVVDNDDGIVLDYTVEIGNPPDAPMLAPAIERVRQRCGRPPDQVTADRGYGKASVDKTLHQRSRCRLRRHSPTRHTDHQTTSRNRHPRVPRTRPLANRRRGPHRNLETPARLGPHPPHRHPRSPNLVRPRRPGPQPHQDRPTPRLTPPDRQP